VGDNGKLPMNAWVIDSVVNLVGLLSWGLVKVGGYRIVYV